LGRFGIPALRHSITPRTRFPYICQRTTPSCPSHNGKVPGGKFIVFRDRLQIPAPSSRPGLPKADPIKHFSSEQSSTYMHTFILCSETPVSDRIRRSVTIFNCDGMQCLPNSPPKEPRTHSTATRQTLKQIRNQIGDRIIVVRQVSLRSPGARLCIGFRFGTRLQRRASRENPTHGGDHRNCCSLASGTFAHAVILIIRIHITNYSLQTSSVLVETMALKPFPARRGPTGAEVIISK
jgi:hypothetical protein